MPTRTFILVCLVISLLSVGTGAYAHGGQRVLSRGCWGEDVFWLQRKLMDLGLMQEATGQYGTITESAVKELQKANGIKADGIAGPQTLALLGETQSFSFYTVQKGDSLYTIAKRLGISMDELVNLNNLSATGLQIGQKLRVPHQPMPATYKVMPGDSLYNIAKAFKVTVQDIASVNNIKNAALIKPGQELLIPSGL